MTTVPRATSPAGETAAPDRDRGPAPDCDRGFTLVLSEAALNVIGEALGNVPYRLAAPVVEEVQRQINRQVAQRMAASPPEKADG